MDRARTLLALAGITLMVGSAGITGARAEDVQAQGSHLNDPANKRAPGDQQEPNKSRLNDPAVRRDPAADTHNIDDKASKRDVR
jgi:hypothetical protein